MHGWDPQGQEDSQKRTGEKERGAGMSETILGKRPAEAQCAGGSCTPRGNDHPSMMARARRDRGPRRAFIRKRARGHPTCRDCGR